MNTLTKTFQNSDIRVAKIDNQLWWNLKDVCIALGMGVNSHRNWSSRLNKDQKRPAYFICGLQRRKMISVNKPGLLKVIWRSNKPKALVFSDWCADVISEILETGRYDVAEHKEQIEQLQLELSNSQEELAQTQGSLAEANAEVNRRVFLVIKRAVAEWRLENGYRHTDFEWRNRNFNVCLQRLLGSVYKKGATPYVFKDYMQTAKTALKRFYGYCQRNPTSTTPPLDQGTLPDFWCIAADSVMH